MKKKLFMFVGLAVLPFVLVGCGDKKTTTKSSESSESSDVVVSSTSVEEEVAETTEVAEEVVPQTESPTPAPKPNTNTTPTTEAPKEQSAADKYYMAIKDAWQKQKEYIESVTDAQMRQSLQTPDAAAFSEATSLSMEHPNDADLIDAQLQKVLAGQ